MNNKHLLSGQFATKRAKKSHLFRNTMLIVAVLIGFTGFGQWVKNKPQTKEQQTAIKAIQEIVVKEVKAESKSEKFDRILREDKEAYSKVKNELVDLIKQKEGQGIDFQGRPTFDPPKIDGKIIPECLRIGGVQPDVCTSHGSYQMKIGTISGWNVQLGGEKLSYEEARAIAFNEVKAREFVGNVLENIPRSCLAWSVCKDSEGNAKPEFQNKLDEMRRLKAEITRFETI